MFIVAWQDFSRMGVYESYDAAMAALYEHLDKNQVGVYTLFSPPYEGSLIRTQVYYGGSNVLVMEVPSGQIVQL